MSTTGEVEWSSRFAFIMAAVGSSVGLGNLWRFSAEAGANGGGAFIIVYLLAVVLVCIPVLMSEYMIGRAGQDANAVGSVADLSRRSGRSGGWTIMPWIGMLAGFLIVTFYCAVAGWVLRYIFKFMANDFAGQDADVVAETFVNFISSPLQVLPWFLIFAAITTYLVARGVNKGIELAAKVLMPLFFVLLLGLAVYALVSNVDNGGTAEALSFLYSPDWGKLTPEVAGRALGQAFFSVGIGSAIMIVYGSYLPRQVSIPKSALLVGLIDTGVALVAGLAIFPIVFAYGLSASAGGGLFFITLPNAFNAMGGAGPFVGMAFFFLAFFAAITSSVSLLEPSAAYIHECFGLTKAKAAMIAGGAMTLIGLGSVFGVEAGGNTWFLDAVDRFTGSVMLPLCGLLVVLFVGWRLDRAILTGEISGEGEGLGRVLMFLTKYVAPFMVAIVLIFSVIDTFFQATP